MPCSGPSQEFAYQQATDAVKDIKSLLKEKYGIDVQLKVQYGFPMFREEQNSNFDKLEELVKDIFWTDACLSF